MSRHDINATHKHKLPPLIAMDSHRFKSMTWVPNQQKSLKVGDLVSMVIGFNYLSMVVMTWFQWWCEDFDLVWVWILVVGVVSNLQSYGWFLNWVGLGALTIEGC